MPLFCVYSPFSPVSCPSSYAPWLLILNSFKIDQVASSLSMIASLVSKNYLTLQILSVQK